MKVSGFSLVRNGLKYFYPFKEAILSVLPLCDEFIINVGKSDDGTLDIIKTINNKKIKIIVREWDMSLRQEGKLLAIETNEALKLCKGDWCFYIQADEVLHEKFTEIVQNEMLLNLNNSKIEGLRFQYRHFYGSFDYYQDNYRRWYTKEVRIIKNNCNIISWGDAMGFKHTDGSEIQAKNINAEIFHYGWVRPPDIMLLKRIDFHKLYFQDIEVERFKTSVQCFDDLGHLKRLTTTHPSVMIERIKLTNWDFDAQLEKQYNDFFRKIIQFLDPVLKRIKKFKKRLKIISHKT